MKHIKGSKWTKKKVDYIRKLAAKGLTCYEIADKMGTNYGSIYGICRRKNIKLEKDIDWIPKKEIDVSKITNKKLYKAMVNKNYSILKLARETQLAERSIQRILYSNEEPLASSLKLFSIVLDVPMEELI